MKNIVIYHKNCLDGTCAAWVASQYLPKDTTYIAVEYGKPLDRQIAFPLPERTGQTINIYILDWCPEMPDLDKLCEYFGKVILIDHHESAIKKLLNHYKSSLEKLDNSNYRFSAQPKNLEVFLAHNNEWSGAMGTAIWFHKNRESLGYPKESNYKYQDHWLVKAVDDRDRWQFKYPDTKAINAALFLLGFNLEDWKKQPFTDTVGWTLKGLSLLEQQEKNVQAIISSAAILDNNIEKIIFCNCPPFLASEVGNILAKDYRMAVLWFMDSEGQISVSLRSNSNTKDWINCAELAQSLKGGGHANAAGFKWLMSVDDMIDEVSLKVERYHAIKN